MDSHDTLGMEPKQGGRTPPHRRDPQAGAPPAGGGGGQDAQGGPTQAGEGPHKATPTPTQEGAPPGGPTREREEGGDRTKEKAELPQLLLETPSVVVGAGPVRSDPIRP